MCLVTCDISCLFSQVLPLNALPSPTDLSSAKCSTERISHSASLLPLQTRPRGFLLRQAAHTSLFIKEEGNIIIIIIIIAWLA